jgi:uncharacterized protein
LKRKARNPLAGEDLQRKAGQMLPKENLPAFLLFFSHVKKIRVHKILSLDGGGTWAIIQARVLQDIYGDITGHELLKKFDLVIANSGGALILAALCNNHKLSETVNLFMDENIRKTVFTKLTFWEKISQRRNWLTFLRFISKIGPKYSTERKITGLRNLMPGIADKYLTELPAYVGNPDLQLIIVGFDYHVERAKFFRSQINSRTEFASVDKEIKMLDAVHSSSTAPVNYFDRPAAIRFINNGVENNYNNYFWDGGVSGFNNPVLAGLVEYITNHPQYTPDDVAILSLGTGTKDKPAILNPADKDFNISSSIITPVGRFKAFDDIQKMATSVLGDPPDSSSFIAYSILNPALDNNKLYDKFVRINPVLRPERPDGIHFVVPAAFEPDDGDAFFRLMEMDIDAVTQDDVKLIALLCDKFIAPQNPAVIVPNQVLRRDDAASRIIGFTNYTSAKKAWQKWI